MLKKVSFALRSVLSILLIGVMVILPIMAAASDMTNTDNSGEQQGGTSDSYESKTGQQRGNPCAQKAETSNMFGVFDEIDGIMDSRFVTFDYNEGTLFNYTLKTEEETMVISSLKIEDFEPTTEPRTSGAMFMMNGTRSRIMVHSNPTGMIQVTANKNNGSIEIKLELAKGLALEKRSNGTYELVGLTNPAYIRMGAAEVAVNGSSIEVEIGTEGHLMFMAVPTKGYGGNEYRHKYTESVINGKIDSELDIVTSNGTHMEQKFNYQGKVEMKVKSMQQNRLKIMVSSEEHEGKVVGIGLDKDSISNVKKSQLQIKLDGKPLIEASYAEDILGSKEGNEGIYYFEEHSGGYHALVFVPEFSEHELSIEKKSAAESGGDSHTAIIPNLLVIVVIICIIFGIMIVIWRKKTYNNS